MACEKQGGISPLLRCDKVSPEVPVHTGAPERDGINWIKSGGQKVLKKRDQKYPLIQRRGD